MQRHLPTSTPLARTRRLLAALPSGLPTSSACVLAAALVVTPIVTLRAVMPPDAHDGGPLTSRIESAATDGPDGLPDRSASPGCAATGGRCPSPQPPTREQAHMATLAGSTQSATGAGSDASAPGPTASDGTRDESKPPSSHRERHSQGNADDPTRSSGDGGHGDRDDERDGAAGRDRAHDGAGGHDGESDDHAGDDGGTPEEQDGDDDPGSGH